MPKKGICSKRVPVSVSIITQRNLEGFIYRMKQRIPIFELRRLAFYPLLYYFSHILFMFVFILLLCTSPFVSLFLMIIIVFDYFGSNSVDCYYESKWGNLFWLYKIYYCIKDPYVSSVHTSSSAREVSCSWFAAASHSAVADKWRMFRMLKMVLTNVMPS